MAKKVRRPRTTDRMKVNCLLAYVHKQFGVYLKCAISGDDMKPEDDVQFDHTHALVHEGPHDWRALRPVLSVPHKKKSARDVRDAAHVKRLSGGNHERRTKPIQSSQFPQTARTVQSTRRKNRAAQ